MDQDRRKELTDLLLLLGEEKNEKEKERLSLKEIEESNWKIWRMGPEQFLEKKEELLKKISPEHVVVLSDREELLSLAKEQGFACIGIEWENQRIHSNLDLILQEPKSLEVETIQRCFERARGIPWHILDTERTYLREMTLEDLDDLFFLYEKPGMTDYLEPLFERKKEEEYTRNYIQYLYGYYGFGMWLVFDRKTRELIGRAGLNPIEIEGEEIIELGYAIATERQGQGLATEVCEAILKYAKEELELDEIFSLIEAENRSSVALIKKLGFQYEKELILKGKSLGKYRKKCFS